MYLRFNPPRYHFARKKAPPLRYTVRRQSSHQGIVVSSLVITSWATVFSHAMFSHGLSVAETIAHIAAIEFLSTGLFITAHDAMHGVVSPNHRKLNDVIGATCLTLYAGFDFNELRTKHWEHHNECGTPGADPDFHNGTNDAFVPWFIRFMTTYMTWGQFVKLQAFAILLMWAGVSQEKLLMFWALPGLLSATRLFYFGTYLPHRPDETSWNEREGHMPPACTRSSDAPQWLSFLRCYHFDYHREHHEHPYTPWWGLPGHKTL
jgi:beta-carotene ketolase (CrtW type)